ncbi:hypothetical protein [Acaryochloris sp. IP29b_bin.148]|uniref:hypothetical protein n=1 Tax=Acaryochloris sp. IP29b_bin.148 TaxID=2969218 RepID=UPI0026291CDF|nr:hypothetical protein [Acaryochloris sp. IP29b_bin.148]
MKSKVLMPLILFAILGLPAKAMAHALETNYVLEDTNKVQFTAVFSTGEPHKNAKVKIYAPNDLSKPVLETQTDENGQFTLETDQKMPGEWEVSIGESGHQDILTVPVTHKGVNLNEISTVPTTPSPQIPLVAIVLSGGMGSAVFATRRLRSQT